MDEFNTFMASDNLEKCLTMNINTESLKMYIESKLQDSIVGKPGITYAKTQSKLILKCSLLNGRNNKGFKYNSQGLEDLEAFQAIRNCVNNTKCEDWVHGSWILKTEVPVGIEMKRFIDKIPFDISRDISYDKDVVQPYYDETL